MRKILSNYDYFQFSALFQFGTKQAKIKHLTLDQQTTETQTREAKRGKKPTKVTITKKFLQTQFTVVFKTVAESNLENNDYLSSSFIEPLRKKCKEQFGEEFGTIDILEGSWGFIEDVFPNNSDNEEKNHFKVTVKWILKLGESKSGR